MKFFRPNQPLISLLYIILYITFSYAPRWTSAQTSGGLIFTVRIFGAKTGCKHRPKVLVKYGDGLFFKSRAGRSGIESRWGCDLLPVQTGLGAHPASCEMGTGVFPGVNWGRGVLLTTHPLLAPRSWKSRAIPLPTLWATPGLKRENVTLFFLLFLRFNEGHFWWIAVKTQSHKIFYFDAKFLVCRFCNCSHNLPVAY